MLQDQGNQPEATAFLFFEGVVVDKGQSQQASRWGQQNWTNAVDLDGETLLWRAVSSPNHLSAGGLASAAWPTDCWETLRKMFLTCCSKSITGFTHPDLPLVPEVLQVNCFDSLQVSNPPPSLPAISWYVGHSNLVSSLRLIAAHTLLTQTPGTCSLLLLVCQDGFCKFCFIS